MKSIRAISGKSVPVYALQHSSLSAVLFIFGPEYMGGHGDLDEKIRKIQEEFPDTHEEEIVKVRSLLWRSRYLIQGWNVL